MREVTARPFRDYFRRGEETDAWLQFRLPLPVWIDWFFKWRHLIHPFTLTTLLLAFGGVLSPLFRAAMIFELSLILSCVALFFRTRSVAQGLYLIRRLPSSAIEKQWLEVTLEIRNTSRFSVSDLLVRDQFTGSMQGGQSRSIDLPIGPGTVHRCKYRYLCDAGMGPHQFGPLALTVSDPFGIFEFTVRDHEALKIEIIPEYIAVPEFRPPASLEAAAAGVREGRTMGQSINFLGVREYRPGDPIRRIHWKLSARHHQLVVKEFESVVNTDLTIVLDMDARNHVGRKSKSTWEYAKDVTLSLLREKLSDVNRIQFMSQGLFVPFGSGDQHSAEMTHRISRLRPANAAKATPLLEEAWFRTPYGSAVIYISPVYQNSPEDMGTLLGALQAKAVRTSCVFIPASPFADEVSAHPAVVARIIEKNQESSKILDQLVLQNNSLGVTTHIVGPGDSISRALAEPKAG